MRASRVARRVDQRTWVTPEHLNVAAPLLGRALARPSRRAAAMAIDLALVALISSLGNAWWLAALLLVGVAQMLADRRGVAMPRAVWAGVAALALAGVGQTWIDRHAPPPPPANADVERDTATQAPPAAVAEALHEAASAAPPGRAEPPGWKERWRQALEDIGLGYGWAIVYFSLWPAWWRGQTPGKRLLGLQVVELTGKPMTVMRSLTRYGGYAAGMATGGLGFAQVLWDPNRQALHDKAAHTVVLDLRRPPRPTGLPA